MLRISSGAASLTAQRAFRQNEKETGRALKELASGSKYVAPGADPAGMAISENLRAQTKGYQAALNNTENASSFLSIAEGALSEQNNIIIRLRELAVQAASDTLSDTEREYLDEEFQQLTAEFDRIANSTSYGSQKLMDGSTRDYEFQVGVNKGDENIISYTNDTDTTASNMGISGLSVGDKDDARDALSDLDDALVNVNGARAKIGAVQSRFESAVNHLQTQVESVSEAHSRMADTDIADAVSRVRRGQVMAQYAAAALRAADDQTLAYLKLVA